MEPKYSSTCSQVPANVPDPELDKSGDYQFTLSTDVHLLNENVLRGVVAGYLPLRQT